MGLARKVERTGFERSREREVLGYGLSFSKLKRVSAFPDVEVLLAKREKSTDFFASVDVLALKHRVSVILTAYVLKRMGWYLRKPRGNAWHASRTSGGRTFVQSATTAEQLVDQCLKEWRARQC